MEYGCNLYCFIKTLHNATIMNCKQFTVRPNTYTVLVGLYLPLIILNVAKAKLYELSNGPSPPAFDGPRLKLI